MLYGHIETFAHRVDHLLRLRALQDETGGLAAFIPLAFHPDGNGMRNLPAPTAVDDLRTMAVSRLLLDNVDHIKAYWVSLTPDVAQIALRFGADDIDGTIVHETIYKSAGSTSPGALGYEELVRLIREAGRVPVERDTLYNVVRELPRAAVPEAALRPRDRVRPKLPVLQGLPPKAVPS
jgi:aminodeoxyfutalosine synthase